MSAEYPNETAPRAQENGHDGATDKPGWTWGFEKLQRILNNTHGSASQNVIEFAKNHLRGVKLVLVFGETGVGKTSLIKEISGRDFSVGHELTSGTKKYEIHATVIGNEQYLFMDTPGFGAADIDDVSNHTEIMKALIAFSSFATFAGVLFIHNSKTTRLKKAETQTLRWLQCLMGPSAFRHVVFVTTGWDCLSAKEVKRARSRNDEFKASENVEPFLFPPPPLEGATWYNHGILGGGIGQEWGRVLDLEEDSDRRTSEIRGYVNSRFRGNMVTEFQVLREIEDDIDLRNVTARIALTADPSATYIDLDGGNAKVKEKESEDIDSRIRQEEDRYNPRKQIGYESSEEFNSFESIDTWLNVIKYFALFFRVYSARGGVGFNRGLLAAAWAAIQNWWNGQMPEI